MAPPSNTEKVEAGKEVVRGISALLALAPSWVRSLFFMLAVIGGSSGAVSYSSPDNTKQLDEIQLDVKAIKEDNSNQNERLIRLEVEQANLKKALDNLMKAK